MEPLVRLAGRLLVRLAWAAGGILFAVILWAVVGLLKA